MAEKTGINDLKKLAELVSRRTGVAFSLDFAYGGVRLCDANGARDLSRRVTRREMFAILDAIDNFWEYAKR